MKGKKFALDPANGKFKGVCAGLANYLGVDATFVRIGAVVVTLLGAFPWTLIAYGAAAWLAKPKQQKGYDIREDIRTLRSGSLRDYRSSMRDIDMRLAEVESYATSANSRRLSREIEELR
jgi:phage shock protein C